MTPQAVLPFTKWEGLGNDFLFVTGEPPPEASGWAVAMCDRHRGIGADGLVFVSSGDAPRMVLFNNDGSRAAMCGNAVRCIGADWFAQGRLEARTWATLETDSGPKRLRVLHAGWVEVDMGAPAVLDGYPEMEPFALVGLPGYRLSMGNPHLVFLCPDGLPSDEQFKEWGQQLQSHPGGINVEWAARQGDRLEVKVWERGAGPTLACGTGACAVAVIAMRVGWAHSPVQVALPGGSLHITWTPGQGVLMAGPARPVFSGQWPIPE